MCYIYIIIHIYYSHFFLTFLNSKYSDLFLDLRDKITLKTRVNENIILDIHNYVF